MQESMPNAHPLVSIVVPNWNGGSVLQECLQSLKSISYKPIEIIVVDNGSVDHSQDIAKSFTDIQLVCNARNLGFAEGVNAGFRRAKGEYVAVLNNDVVVDPDWLVQPLKILTSYENIGIIGCRQMNFDNHSMIDDLYSIPTRHLLFWRMGHGKPYESVRRYSIPGFVIGASGASAIYRKKMLDKIGLFEEKFYAYQEECDLHMRAFLAGWKCAFSPDAVVYHRGSMSFKKIKASFYYYHERNRIWFIYRNFPMAYILRNLFAIIYRECRTMLNIAVIHRMPLTYCRARWDGFFGMLTFRDIRLNNVKLFKQRIKDFEQFQLKKIIPFEG
jgi:GT2 family glycosyltransferase